MERRFRMKMKRKNSRPLSMLTIVRPVILVNQFLGVCPHEIEGEILIFRKNSPKFYKTLFTIGILLLHLTFTTVQFFRALVGGQSMTKLGFLLGAMTSPFMSLLILCVTLQKRVHFTKFFVKCQQFPSIECLKGISTCPLVVKLALRFYAFYMFLVLLQAFVVLYDSLRHPTSEIYFLYYIRDPSPALVAFNCIYQFYLVIIAQSACAFVEVLCAAVSGSIISNLQKIHAQMIDIAEEKSFELDKIPDGNLKPRLQNVECQLTNKNEAKNGRAYCIPLYPTLPLMERKEVSNKIEPIMKAIKCCSYIAMKQRLINCIFGSILVLDIAWLVIHVCLVFFLQIKSLSLGVPSEVTPILNNTLSNDSLTVTTSFQGIDPESTFYVTTFERIWYFAGHGLIYIIRLMIVLIMLGRVHETSKWFDMELITKLTKVQDATPTDLQLIQVHLLGSQSCPTAFSAGGYFIFNRPAILYVFSIVTTYVIFMLQA